MIMLHLMRFTDLGLVMICKIFQMQMILKRKRQMLMNKVLFFAQKRATMHTLYRNCKDESLLKSRVVPLMLLKTLRERMMN